MKKAIDLSKEQINYVALGDSISEGYSEYLQFGDAGKLEKNRLSGTSWPSFLVHLIKEIQPNAIASFYNFALSSSRPEDWNYFLNGKPFAKYNKTNSEQKIKIAKQMQANKNHPDATRLEKYFHNFKDSEFKFLVEKIQAANLISFNLGANYLLPKIPYDDLVKLILKNDSINIDSFKEQLLILIKGVADDLKIMIDALKKINPNAWIICVGYVLPFNPLFSMINDLFNEFKVAVDQEILTFMIDQLNQQLNQICQEKQIIFIDVFNEIFWKKHQQKLTEVFYDIHPVAKGYKKIAQDVLIKISLAKQFNLNDGLTIDKEIPSFNQAYFERDFQNWKQCLNFEKLKITDQNLINLIYGKSQQKLFSETKNEILIIKKYQPFDFEKMLRTNSESGIVVRIKKIFFEVLAHLNFNISNEKWADLTKFFDQQKIKNFLIESKLISDLMWSIQMQLNQVYQNKNQVNYQEWINIVILNVFNIKHFASYIKLFLICLEMGKTKSKLMINFISDLINKALEDKQINEMVNNLILKIFNVLMAKMKIKLTKPTWRLFSNKLDLKNKFLAFLEEFYFYSKTHLNKLKTMHKSKDIFKFYFLNNFSSIDINDAIKTIFTDDDLNQTFYTLFEKVLDIEKLKPQEIKKISTFILKTSDFIGSKPIFKELLMEILIWLLFEKQQEDLFQKIIDFLLARNKKTFVAYLDIVINTNWSKTNETNLNLMIETINLIFKKSNLDGFIYSQIKNISNSQLIINKATNKPNFLKMLSILEKVVLLIKPLQAIFNQLYQKYQTSKNPELAIDYHNKYYQFMFRLILSSLLISYNLFQKNLNKNIFWLNWITNKLSPSIVSTFFRCLVNKNEDDPDKINFFLTMLGEKDNPNLNNNVNEHSYKKQQLIWYIFSHEKQPIDRHTNQNKIDLIFKSLKLGYWIFEDDKK